MKCLLRFIHKGDLIYLILQKRDYFANKSFYVTWWMPYTLTDQFFTGPEQRYY